MLCPNCKSPIQETDKFCGECAHPLQPTIKSQLPQDIESPVTQSTTYTSKETPIQHEQVKLEQVSNEKVHTERLQHEQSQAAVNKPQFDFTKSSKQIALEGRHFFRDALKHHDEIINQPKSYSYGLLGALFGAGLIVLFIATMLLLPNQLENIGVSQGEIAFKVTFAVLAFLVLSIVLTYGIIRLIVKEPLSFQKFLSNYILLNTISIMLFTISWLLTFMDLRIVPGILTVLGLSSLLIASVYLITKAASNYSVRFGSFYGVVIYFVVQIIFLILFLNYLYKTAVINIQQTTDGIMESFNIFNNF